MSTSNKGEENKEENPLLTRGFAFSFGKQGGLDVFSYFEERLKKKKGDECRYAFLYSAGDNVCGERNQQCRFCHERNRLLSG